MKRTFSITVGSIAHTYRQLIIGCVVLEGELQVGDHFSGLKVRQHDVTIEPIDLTVARILFYGKYISRVSRGCSAEIELSGNFELRLAPGEILIGDSDEPLTEPQILGAGEQRVLTV